MRLLAHTGPTRWRAYHGRPRDWLEWLSQMVLDRRRVECYVAVVVTVTLLLVLFNVHLGTG